MAPRARRIADIVASVPELDQAHLLEARHAVDDRLGQRDLALGRRAEGGAPQPAASRMASITVGMGVAEDGRAVALHVVDVAVALDVPHVGALGPRSTKYGVPPTERNARTGEFTPPGMRREAAVVELALVRVAVGGRAPGTTRPASRAKYVRTKSAPARLMAVICSSATASPSIQPRSAAALTIAYSPDTW